MQSGTVNNKSLANLYLLVILSLTYTAAQFWPLLRYAMLFIIIGFGLPFLISRKFFTTHIFWWWLAYITVVALNVMAGDKYFNNNMTLLYEAAYLFIPASMMYYALSNDDLLFQKRSLVLFFFILLLTVVATAFISRVYSGVVRNVNAYSASENEGFYASLFKWGLSDYSMTHSLPCLVPAVILGLKNHSMKPVIRIMLWVTLVSLVVMAYLSGSFACFVITIGSLIISMVVKEGTMSANIGRLLVFALFLALILTPSVRMSVLDKLESSVDSESDFYVKIVELQEMEQAENALDVEGDFSTRMDLYTKSINQGYSDFLFGSDGALLGNHSSFLDRFGSLGLVGILPYLIFLMVTVSYSLRFIPSQYKVYYWIGLFSSFLMLAFKSINSWKFWLLALFILPVAIIIFAPKEEPDETINQIATESD